MEDKCKECPREGECGGMAEAVSIYLLLKAAGFESDADMVEYLFTVAMIVAINANIDPAAFMEKLKETYMQNTEHAQPCTFH